MRYVVVREGVRDEIQGRKVSPNAMTCAKDRIPVTWNFQHDGKIYGWATDMKRELMEENRRSEEAPKIEIPFEIEWIDDGYDYDAFIKDNGIDTGIYASGIVESVVNGDKTIHQGVIRTIGLYIPNPANPAALADLMREKPDV